MSMTTKPAICFSPYQLFAKVFPYLSETLVPRDQRERILKFAELLPQDLPLFSFGFEKVADSPINEVDVGLVLDIPSLDLGSLRESFRIENLDPSLQKNGAWRRLSSLLEKAANEQLLQKLKIRQLWLEFDVGTDKSWPPSPNILPTCYLGCDPKNVISGLEFLRSKKTSPSISEMVHCAAGYGLSGHAFGCMLARNDEWVKIAFCPLSLKSFERFLRDISYLYPIQRLRNLIEKIAPLVDFMQIQIDAMQAPSPKIGIECLFNEITFEFSRWEPLVKLLISEGLMLDEEKAAISSWVGGTRYFLNDEPKLILRHLSHIKIVYHHEKPLKAKLYWGALCKN